MSGLHKSTASTRPKVPSSHSPMNKSIQSEKEFQRAVIQLARLNGWHFSDSRRQVRPGVFVGDKEAKGFPDLVLVRAQRLLFVELKSQDGRVKPEQQEALDLLSAVGGGVEAHLWRPADWDTEITLALAHKKA
jgi:VRR-NUC domain